MCVTLVAWRLSCDVLSILGFVFSLLPIILVPVLAFIYMAVVHKCCKTSGELCLGVILSEGVIFSDGRLDIHTLNLDMHMRHVITAV